MEILLPSQVSPAYRCICGKEFYSKKAGIRHTAKCSEAEVLVEAHLAHQQSNSFTSPTDPEADDWKRRRRKEGKPGANNRGGMA